jgi:hypothetical protein
MKRGLAIQTAVALVLAGVAVVTFVLPAETGTDPTGLGKLMGLTEMAGPQAARMSEADRERAAAVHHPAKGAFRTDEIEIKLAAGGQPGSEVERKVWGEPGQSFVYSWESDGEVYSDFHGETLPKPKLTVMTYRIEDPLAGGAARAASGGFTAPMAGFHGWFFRNMEGRPVTVRVKLAGFYDTRPYEAPAP